jgi:antitoxin CcdA
MEDRRAERHQFGQARRQPQPQRQGAGKVRELGINLSATVDALLTAEVHRRYWERWNADNKEAIEHYNARIEREGVLLARYRSFMKEAG